MMAAAWRVPDEPRTTTDVVAPVLSEVNALIAATHDVRERLKLVSISRWLRLLLDHQPDRWPDVGRIGTEASSIVIGLVEQIDDSLDDLEMQTGMGWLDWSMVRRHMVLSSRRHRVVSVAVALDDLVHALAARQQGG
ncbi:MAG: hypothetical protein KC549_09525 [Myxococcales bacterium]|nr:hypothetical protein [Myxococcales bacterium]MCB9548681.1 hypothetical protein [Myxococcales bacterium]